jgi:hypothetical protein
MIKLSAGSGSKRATTRREPVFGTRVVRAVDPYALWLAERERERRYAAASTTPVAATRLKRSQASKEPWSRIPIRLSPELW